MNFKRPGETDEAYAERVLSAKIKADLKVAEEEEAQSEPITIEAIREKMNPALTKLGNHEFHMNDSDEQGRI